KAASGELGAMDSLARAEHIPTRHFVCLRPVGPGRWGGSVAGGGPGHPTTRLPDRDCCAMMAALHAADVRWGTGGGPGAEEWSMDDCWKRQITRRKVLAGAASVGLGAMAAACAPPGAASSSSSGGGGKKQLRILQWSHFVPAYDKWIDQFVA